MPSNRPPLSAEDLFSIAFVGDPQLSPDGKHVAYCVKHGRLEENKYVINLHLVASGGGEPRQLTYGDQNDTLPRWSPDGRTLAFVSNRHDKKDQVHLLPADGGEARRLTDVDGCISDLAWSPDGDRLVFVMRPLSEEQRGRRDAEKKGELAKRPAFQVHTNIHYKEDGLGFLFDTHAHLHLVDVASGETRQLTDGNTEDMQPVFSPDGKTIAFASNRLDNPQRNLDNIDICTVPVNGGSVRRVTPQYGPNLAPSFSPDGKLIAYAGTLCETKGEAFWRDLDLWVVPVSGGEPKNLTPDLDRTYGDLCIADAHDVANAYEPPIWSADGKHLTFLISDAGSVIACRVPVEGGKLERLTSPGREIAGMTADARRGRFAFMMSDHTHPGEVAVLDPAEGGTPQWITHHNRDLLESRWIGNPEEVWIPTDPGVKVQGWILKPPTFEKGKRYPAILEIHGGPHMQYANTFFHEMQYLAGKGYVVMWTNPRGSQGYGEAHTSVIVKNWGGPDYVDVMAAADYLIEQGYIDPARFGVTGGSYGGYMTNWIVGHTDRFKAAATQRSVVNLYS
ncbi:MAG TPA: S9 family peptidase, partial [Candidatus Eisenbacteria bacterium]|nr:S9 family peptidase [Candidatus Eisenbacteria bacterium]